MNSEIETEAVGSDEDAPPELVDGTSSHLQPTTVAAKKVPITIVTGMDRGTASKQANQEHH
jgi:hypothetical protein